MKIQWADAQPPPPHTHTALPYKNDDLCSLILKKTKQKKPLLNPQTTSTSLTLNVPDIFFPGMIKQE